MHHLSISRGSLLELQTHLEIAMRLGFAPDQDIATLGDSIEEVGKMLYSMIESLERKAIPKL